MLKSSFNKAHVNLNYPSMIILKLPVGYFTTISEILEKVSRAFTLLTFFKISDKSQILRELLIFDANTVKKFFLPVLAINKFNTYFNFSNY